MYNADVLFLPLLLLSAGTTKGLVFDHVSTVRRCTLCIIMDHMKPANLVVALTMNHCDVERANHQHSLHKLTILFRDPLLSPAVILPWWARMYHFPAVCLSTWACES